MGFVETIATELGSIIAFVGAGIAGYFAPKISNRIKGYLNQRWFNASLKKSLDIKVMLAELKGKLAAQRIYFLQFHNGKVYLGDNQFHKYSVSAIFEVVNQGLSREITNMQNVPLNTYAELLSYMQNKDEDVCLIGDHKGCDLTFEASDLDDLKHATNQSSILYIKTRNKNNVFIGLLAIYFDKEVSKTKLLTDMKDLQELDYLLLYIKNHA